MIDFKEFVTSWTKTIGRISLFFERFSSVVRDLPIARASSIYKNLTTFNWWKIIPPVDNPSWRTLGGMTGHRREYGPEQFRQNRPCHQGIGQPLWIPSSLPKWSVWVVYGTTGTTSGSCISQCVGTEVVVKQWGQCLREMKESSHPSYVSQSTTNPSVSKPPTTKTLHFCSTDPRVTKGETVDFSGLSTLSEGFPTFRETTNCRKLKSRGDNLYKFIFNDDGKRLVDRTWSWTRTRY